MPTELDKFGGRKFLFCTTTVLINAGLVLGHIISDSVYQAIVIAVITGYLTANVAQKVFVKTPQE